MWIEAIGWISASLLAVTLGVQVARPFWPAPSMVPSCWLLGGQLLAAAGFLGYSVSQRSWVFTFLSSLMLLGAAVELVVVLGAGRRRRVHLPGRQGRVIWLASMRPFSRS